MSSLTASIVVYRSDPADLESLFGTLAASGLQQWTVVDNSAHEFPELAARIAEAVAKYGGRYTATPRNLGFGAGHNFALRALKETPSDFHVMLNPDIHCEPEAFAVLAKELGRRPDVGIIMPKVFYVDGTFQPVCKLMPTPFDFALRRFAPGFVQSFFAGRLAQYEMTGIENLECDQVPFLSGCFLFARRSVLEEIQGFDERFFLYLEDVDLCRRVAGRAKLLYWPHASVVHVAHRGAYRSRKLMLVFLRSAVDYFNKWGWILDSERKKANRHALECLRTKAGTAPQ